MRATGIVVEYNPFHNGHLYHVAQAKKIAQADVCVAVMSGSFLQRGEPAVVDKWTRTKMALHAGVDIVIELPYAYSTAQARQFASGSISLLHAIGCESVVFGSENGDIAPFLHTHYLISTYHEEYEAKIHEAMQQGVSYPKALQHAYQHVLTYATEATVDLAQPNNILGYHYVEAAHELTIRPLTIPRIGAHYHDEALAHDSIASATAIRKALLTRKICATSKHSYLRQRMKRSSIGKRIATSFNGKRFGRYCSIRFCKKRRSSSRSTLTYQKASSLHLEKLPKRRHHLRNLCKKSNQSAIHGRDFSA